MVGGARKTIRDSEPEFMGFCIAVLLAVLQSSLSTVAGNQARIPRHPHHVPPYPPPFSTYPHYPVVPHQYGHYSGVPPYTPYPYHGYWPYYTASHHWPYWSAGGQESYAVTAQPTATVRPLAQRPRPPAARPRPPAPPTIASHPLSGQGTAYYTPWHHPPPPPPPPHPAPPAPLPPSALYDVPLLPGEAVSSTSVGVGGPYSYSYFIRH